MPNAVFEVQYHCPNCNFTWKGEYEEGDIVEHRSQGAYVHKAGHPPGGCGAIVCPNCHNIRTEIVHRRPLGRPPEAEIARLAQGALKDLRATKEWEALP